MDPRHPASSHIPSTGVYGTPGAAAGYPAAAYTAPAAGAMAGQMAAPMAPSGYAAPPPTTAAYATGAGGAGAGSGMPMGASTSAMGAMGAMGADDGGVPVAKMTAALDAFWERQRREAAETSGHLDPNSFKTNNDLPLARIKRIMKSDEDVRMIRAETPVLFAKACELFILELTIRAWCFADKNKRRNLHKEDVQAAVAHTEIFDFLVEVINTPPPAPSTHLAGTAPAGPMASGASAHSGVPMRPAYNHPGP